MTDLGASKKTTRRVRKPTPSAVVLNVENTIRQELETVRSKYGIIPGPNGLGIFISNGHAASPSDKKNFAQELSTCIAQRVADALRGSFPGLLPRADGSGQESKAKTVKGYKKLDINYSTPELGLGLGVSIKTLNFRDEGSSRYTKNITRIDNELRAEASDYHERQPYAVLIGIVFIPVDSADDALQTSSSFGQAVQVFRYRTGRKDGRDSPNLFERIFIGLYEPDGSQSGVLTFVDASLAPPKTGRPKSNVLTFQEVLAETRSEFYRRNNPDRIWEDQVASESDVDEIATEVQVIANLEE